VTLGSQLFIGQFVTNWNAVLSALSLAMFPILVLYVIFSRQLIRGITAVSDLLAAFYPQDGSQRDEDELPNQPHVF